MSKSLNPSTQTLLDMYDQFLMPNYAPLPFVPEKALGSRMWDAQGSEIIDFSGGIAVLALGHNHPSLVESLTRQANMLWYISNYCTNVPALRLAEKLCELTFAEKVFLSNSGAEANEAALKLARKYAYENYGNDKNEIVSFNGSFHGRTLFTVTVGGQEKYREGFGPLPEGIYYAEYNNIEDLTSKVSDKTCAVIMEIIMGEGGVIEADPEFIVEVRKVCDKHQALLIFDEVQTGVGRTGYLYAYQEFGIVPDILTTAKALGCGFPIAATLTTTKIAKTFSVGSHGTTFGGNALACSVAETVLGKISNPDLLQGVKDKRKIFDQRIDKINREFGLFEETRGKGLLIGCVLQDKWKGKAWDIAKSILKSGVFLLIAGPDVIRFAPSLIIPENDILEGMNLVEKGIQEFISG